MNLAGRLKIAVPVQRHRESDLVDHDLTLIIPAYNEESRLPKTLTDAKAFLDDWGINYRVIVVDDGSSDATGTMTSSYGRRFSTIRQSNGGKGSAVRNGVLAARGRIVAFTDADLPYDLTALKSAYETIELDRCDVVFGSRNVSGAASQVDRRWLRVFASFVFRSMMMMLVSRSVTDTQCGLKVFNRQSARQIFSQATVNGFAFDAEVVYLTHLFDLSFETVPVILINEYSSTISLFRNAIPMLMDVVGVRMHAIRGGYNRDLEVETLAIEGTVAGEQDAARRAA